MKRTAITLTFAVALLFGLVFYSMFIQPAESQSVETIYVRADGSVEGIDKIQRDGDLYFFTADISSSIIIEKNNVVIDGAGYALRGKGIDNGILLKGKYNVTIKNMRIAGFYYGIWITRDTNSHPQHISSKINVSSNILEYNTVAVLLDALTHNNFILNNTVRNNRVGGIEVRGSSRNQIVGNNISGNRDWAIALLEVYMMFGVSSSQYDNVVYHNNFIDNALERNLQVSMPGSFTESKVANANFWDFDGEGNYWSDYKTRYPDAAEIDASGVGNTAFFINQNNIDRYPLIRPFMSPEPTNSSELQVFPIILAITFIATVAVASVGLIVYLKKRKR